LEHRDLTAPTAANSTVLALAPPSTLMEDNELYDALDKLEPDCLSPRDALDWLYKLKAIAAKIR
jgi:DNA mismatch repair protein MutS